MRTELTYRNMAEFHKRNIEQKKPNTRKKAYLNDFIYIKVKNRRVLTGGQLRGLRVT